MADPQKANFIDLELNDEQLRFIKNIHGPAELHASMGTGKTLALAERAAEAIRQGVDPRRILCVTFTNRAAEEMRNRIIRRCGPQSRHVRVSTFHALCAWMLRVEAKTIGIPRDFTIFDEDDTKEILANLATNLAGHLLLDQKSLSQLAHVMAKLKVEAPSDTLNPNLSFDRVFSSLNPEQRKLALSYQHTLREYHAVDFSDLVFFVRCMLFSFPKVRKRWEHRFELVQVDEVQDTHIAEYDVVSLLASTSGNLVLAGDFDQTIYEWRGSNPDRVLRSFRRQYPSAQRFRFTVNYRSTRVLLDVAASVAGSFSTHVPPTVCKSAAKGELAVTHFAADEFDEARWIGSRISRVKQRGVDYGRMAVLVRTNQRAQVVSQELQKSGIPHLTVETYEFFRRQEVKDALAYLRFLANPWDEQSLRRVIARPARGIGARTLARLVDGADAGLRLMDFANEHALSIGDPLGSLIDAWGRGEVTVFDTETTGLDPSEDEIVELAGIKLRNGVPVATFHQYVQNEVPVGESEAIHGLSDAFLQREGAPARQVLTEFAHFVGSSTLVGHNVEFDMRMLRANTGRLNIAFPNTNPSFDTLDMARRFVELEDYRLETLAHHFSLTHMPQHHALDDVKATCELLRVLMQYAQNTAARRRQVVAELADAFRDLAAEVTRFRGKLGERPPQLLDSVLRDSGLFRLYQNDGRRKANLLELRRIMYSADRLDLRPRESLDAFLTITSLSRNIDRLDGNDDRVKVLTVHQAKGLEFDVVFVAGLSEGEFPSFLAQRDGNEAEERRVFYVAVTRAKELLFLSGHARYRDWRRRPSPYFDDIGDRWVEEGSAVLTRARSS